MRRTCEETNVDTVVITVIGRDIMAQAVYQEDYGISKIFREGVDIVDTCLLNQSLECNRAAESLLDYSTQGPDISLICYKYD